MVALRARNSLKMILKYFQYIFKTFDLRPIASQFCPQGTPVAALPGGIARGQGWSVVAAPLEEHRRCSIYTAIRFVYDRNPHTTIMQIAALLDVSYSYVRRIVRG